MQFKKLVAVAGSALMAGMALATPALAATTVAEISSVPALEDGVPTYKVVFGAGAAAEDVAAGADLASWAASLTGAEKTMDSTISSTVTGGVELASPTTKLYYDTAINTARTSLTKTEMPVLLTPGVVVGTTGSEYKYDLLINIGDSGKIDFGRSASSLSSSDLHLDFAGATSGVAASNYFYKMDVVFSKALNVSAADVDSKTITLFGKTYTIGTGTETTATKLVLYGKGEEIPMSWVGDAITETATIGDKEIEVVLKGVTSTSTADLEINGISYTNQSAGSYISVAGTTVYLKSVSYYGTNNGGIVVRLGADKVTLDNNTKVKTGTDNTEMDGTLVIITSESDKISKIEIAVFDAAQSSDYVLAGEEFVDPVFGSFKVKFSGMNPALTSDTRETIEVAVATDDIASLTYTDRSGAAANLDVATNNYAGAAGQTTAMLADSNIYNYTVVENATFGINDYVILNNAGESFLLQFTSATLASTSSNTTRLSSVYDSSDYYDISFGSNGDVAQTATSNIGSKSYTVTVVSNTDGSEQLAIQWNTAGTTAVYPTIRTANGANIALMKPVNITGLNRPNATSAAADIVNSTLVILPSGTGTDSPTQTATVYYNNTTVAAGHGNGIINVTVGDSTVCEFTTSTDNTCNIGQANWNFSITNHEGGADNTTLQVMSAYTSSPGVFIREGKDSSGSTDAYQGIVVAITTDASTPKKVDVVAASPTLTGTQDTQYTAFGQTDNSYVSKALNIYGSLLTKDTTTGGRKLTIAYPSSQAVGEIFVLTEEGVIDSTSSGDTYREQVEITADVAMVDTEVTAADKANFDMFVIGGPCVNKIAADLLELDGYTCGEDSKIPEGKGVVQVFEGALGEGKVAVLVAGWEKAETNLAARAIQTGALEDQTGMEVTISGTSVDALTIE